MKKEIRIKAFIAVLLGNVIFGFSFLFSKLALEMVEPEVLIAIRFTVAFLALNLIVLAGKITGKGNFKIKGKPKKEVLLLALCQPVIYFIAESYGIKLTSSSFAGIIIAMIPIVGIMADAFIMHESIGKKHVICAILSIGGVVLTTMGASDMQISLKGLLMLLVAVVAGAMFYVFSKRAGEHYSPLERTYVMFAVGSGVYVLIALIKVWGRYKEVLSSINNPLFAGCIAYLAIFSSVLAFTLLNFGSNYVSVSNATLLANSTTVISIIAGVIVLKESFSIPQAIGAAVIIVSVTLGEIAKR